MLPQFPEAPGLCPLVSALNKKQVSSVEVTHYYLGRCQELDPQLNSFITVDADRALAAARSSDARRAQGTAGLLEGVPLAHKDIFCAKDWRTTCGSKMLSNFISPYDAHLIAQFAQEGAFILGKTNMDEFAMGSSNETSAFGPVKNPWDTTRVPGGSSGGSAAAVVAGLAPAATGTDTGGSIRQPAAFCGLTGLKPTYGLVSRFGMVAFASSLDQAGPIAVSAEDCALMLEVMCGFDERDSTSINCPREKYSSRLKTPASHRSLEGLRLGVPEEFFPSTLAGNVRKVVEQALEKMCELGAQMVSVRLPQVELSLPAYYVIAPAEASSNLSRFDGVRYGYRSPHARTLEELYSKSRSEGFGDEVKRRILTGTYVLSHGYYDAYYLQAQKIRQLVANNFVDAFQKCDLIVGPTTPTTAFPLGFHPDNPVEMYLSDIFTIPANLAGMPAMSLPCGFDEQGLPVGLHMMGKAFDEGRMLEVAHRYQQATDWTLQRPKLP